MTFLNATLLAGAAAFLIPLIIHLLNRAKFQVVEWGAMHLLNLDVQVNSRRLQLRTLLLLIVRCAIPVTLALCLARPVLTAWKSAGGQGNAALVLLLDNSLSMQAFAENTTSANATALDSAKKEATQLIAELGAGTRYTILTTGGKPTGVSSGATADWRSAAPMLASIQGGAGPSRIVDSLSAAIESFEQMPEARRIIALVSDFQRSEWQDLSESTLVAIRNRLASGRIATRIALFPIRTKATENLSIEVDPTVRHTAVLGQPLEIKINAVNHSDKLASKVTVTLQVDGRELAQRTVEVAAKSKVQAAFACQFDSAGSHLVTAKLDDSSAVSGDNSAQIAVRVIDRIETLIVDPSMNLPLMQRESAFLNLALTPLASSLSAESDLIRAIVVSRNSIDDTSLDHAQVVILVDVPDLRDEQADRLANFANRGGVLIIFAGHSLKADWYNTHWGTSAKNHMLPLKYAALSTATIRGIPTSRIRQEVFSHPALSMFNNRDNGELARVSFHSWYRLEQFRTAGGNESDGTREATASDNPVDESRPATSMVIASLDTGDPLFAEMRVGQGLVIQSASSCDSLWSDLPQRPVFLPLIQQLVTASIMTSQADTSFETGQPYSLVLQKRDSARELVTKPAVDHLIRGTVTTPSSLHYPVVSVQHAQQTTIDFDQTQYPGGYELRFEDSDSSTDNRKAEYFVATATAGESNLETMSEEELSAIASSLGADIIHSTGDFLHAENERQFGREIWRYVLLALIAFLFGELWLQQRLARNVA